MTSRTALRLGLFATMLVVVLTITGCAISPYFGTIYTDSGMPAKLDPLKREVWMKDKDYDILGPATGQASVANVLGLVATGSDGITAAYADALKTYAGANMLIDAHVDTKIQRVLSFYVKATTVVTGIAVRLKP